MTFLDDYMPLMIGGGAMMALLAAVFGMVSYTSAPSGEVATGKVLEWFEGECLIQAETERLIARDCKSIAGETVTVEKTNGGYWKVKEAAN